MKILGPNGIFPVMLRSTHRQEYIRMSQTYQREVSAETSLRLRAEQELRRERERWAEFLDRFSGYQSEDGTTHLAYGDPSDSNMVAYEMHRDRQQDQVKFFFSISAFLLDRMRVFDERDSRHIIDLMKDHITKLLWEKIVGEAIH